MTRQKNNSMSPGKFGLRIRPWPELRLVLGDGRQATLTVPADRWAKTHSKLFCSHWWENTFSWFENF